ncbi:hypothetical protein EI94DRAFT_1807029 [Lactarius quietus]|nr:hypothetical protein EI94DRAFT_1807029 [Lactarius quietus]
MEKEKEKLAHVQSHKTTIAKTAQMEADIRRTYEDKRRHAHNPPPVATAHVPRPRLPSISSEEPDFDQVDKVQCRQDSEDLEEGEVDTVGAHDGIDDDEPQELLDPSGDEQPKTQKCKTASKKGELREQVNVVTVADSLPSTVKKGKGKRKAVVDEQPDNNSRNKKPKGAAKAGPYSDWRERASMMPDHKPSASGANRLSSRSSSAVSQHSTILSTAAIGSHRASYTPTVVGSDKDQLGALSELEGTETYPDESSAAEDVTGSRWASDPGFLVGPQGRRLVPRGPRPLRRTYATIIPTTSIPTFSPPTVNHPRRKCLHEHWKNCHDYPEAHTWEARDQKDIEEEEAVRALVAAEDDSYLAFDEACRVRQLALPLVTNFKLGGIRGPSWLFALYKSYKSFLSSEAWKRYNLPAHLATQFDAVFSPHLRMIFGKTHPWEMPNDKHLKQVWATVFTEEAPLDFDTPLGLMVHKLIVDRLSSWRHNIGSAGLLALQSKVFSTLQGSDVVKARSKWCTWAVSRTEGDHPFYFASIVEDLDGNVQSQSGIFQSKLISAILGTC